MMRYYKLVVVLLLSLLLAGCGGNFNWIPDPVSYGSVSGTLYMGEPTRAVMQSNLENSVRLSVGDEASDVVFTISENPQAGYIPCTYQEITVEGTGRSDITDEYGRFYIDHVPTGPQNLSLTYNGTKYTTTSPYNQTTGNVALGLGQMPVKKSLTVMVYMIGDNAGSTSLESAMAPDINEMEAGINENTTNVVVFADPYETWDPSNDGSIDSKARIYDIKHDLDNNKVVSSISAYPTEQYSSEYNMADPDNLRSFVEWAKIRYPANTYMLVLWDHGDGITIHNDPTRMQAKAIGPDDNSASSNSFIDVWQIADALSGLGIDIVGFDACIMGGIEVAYELKDVTDYVVASEEMEPGAGWDYSDLLSRTTALASASSIAKAVVDSYTSTYTGATRQTYYTLSAVNTYYLDDAVDLFGELCTAIYNSFLDPNDRIESMSAVSLAINSTIRFADGYGYYFYDMADLVSEIMNNYIGFGLSGSVINAANTWLNYYDGIMINEYVYTDNVIARVYPISKLDVGDIIEPIDISEPTGLSIFGKLAKNWNTDDSNYTESSFAKDTGWANILTAISAL